MAWKWTTDLALARRFNTKEDAEAALSGIDDLDPPIYGKAIIGGVIGGRWYKGRSWPIVVVMVEGANQPYFLTE